MIRFLTTHSCANMALTLQNQCSSQTSSGFHLANTSAKDYI